MTSILLWGEGRMGRCLAELIGEDPALSLAGTAGPESPGPLPGAGAGVDFSHPALLPRGAAWARERRAAYLCGTTGLSPGDFALLRELGREVPVLWSANFSLGAAAMVRAARLLAEALPDFDPEILELHHRGKKDAPSGTARLLMEAADPERRRFPVWGRHGAAGPRDPRELGVHSLRGGSEAGVHSLLLLGEGESLELCHRAAGREVFARGALAAVKRLAGLPPGFYTLEEVLDAGKEAP